MSAPIDSTAGPLPSIAKALAQAAVQRQNSLLGADREGALPAAASAAPAVAAQLPAGAAVPTPPPLPIFTLPPGTAAGATGGAASSSSSTLLPLPEGATQVSLSAQARQGWQASSARDAAPGSGGGGGGSASVGAGGMGGAQALSARAWPTAGAPAPWLALAQSLVQQLTAQSAVPQRVVAAQAWPAGLAQALEAAGNEGHDMAPPLQTWLVGQGSVQTPEGARSVALTLRVPVPWLAAQPSAASPALAAPGLASLQAPFAAPGNSLQSGLLALVLQGPQGARTSALLSLDVQPWLATQIAQVYGRDVQQLQQQQRTDPWLLMALMEAQARRPSDALERDAQRELCQTPSCPYAGRAECEQPFCVALRTVVAVAPAEPVPGLGRSSD